MTVAQVIGISTISYLCVAGAMQWRGRRVEKLPSDDGYVWQLRYGKSVYNVRNNCSQLD